ncbi:hypothetical protein M427DRAFT_358124 [Gonapodya prolifera JEL478]|uniref:Uncharacterized protein n=1 Tax=Gonapodya prolifera (strain JEL478) TaxID=1344416 RepID=A0A139AAR7_GONPJ|nr:hypothetical protein M427DRAFT_358124 [Gonapodya prolifera JEL478]|eukprot:KXS13837.1 hypothetical protein M427DRAFT_358124 [Gonapodya prolifera JEL478]
MAESRREPSTHESKRRHKGKKSGDKDPAPPYKMVLSYADLNHSLARISGNHSKNKSSGTINDRTSVPATIQESRTPPYPTRPIVAFSSIPPSQDPRQSPGVDSQPPRRQLDAKVPARWLAEERAGDRTRSRTERYEARIEELERELRLAREAVERRDIAIASMCVASTNRLFERNFFQDQLQEAAWRLEQCEAYIQGGIKSTGMSTGGMETLQVIGNENSARTLPYDKSHESSPLSDVWRQ